MSQDAELDAEVCATAGMREGMLMKRGRDNGQFFSRRFVLLEREGTLKYYAKQDVSPSHPRDWGGSANNAHSHTYVRS